MPKLNVLIKKPAFWAAAGGGVLVIIVIAVSIKSKSGFRIKRKRFGKAGLMSTKDFYRKNGPSTSGVIGLTGAVATGGLPNLEPFQPNTAMQDLVDKMPMENVSGMTKRGMATRDSDIFAMQEKSMLDLINGKKGMVQNRSKGSEYERLLKNSNAF